VISAKGRALESIGRSAANYVDLLQTDASINPGNSGGPLVNIDGQVVGVNVAIASSGMSQGNIGIGFAIPINTAKMVAEQLMDKGKVVRGYLGVAVSPANRELCVELRDQLKCYEGGALIETVNPSTPAAKAGVKEGDVIVKFGAMEVHNFTDLEKAVAVTRPGDTIPADVIRDGKQVHLNITVMERPSEDTLIKGQGGEPGPGRNRRREQPETGTRSKYGLSIRPATDGKGVEITGVTVGSPAFESGLQAGDVITQVGTEPVATIDAFQKALNTAPTDQGIVLKVMTPVGMRFVVVRP
jgi:serine protease Do